MLVEIDEERRELSDFEYMIINSEFARKTSHSSVVLKIGAEYSDISFDF